MPISLIVAGVAAAAAAGGAVYLTKREGRYRVSRSLDMAVEPEAVFARIRDLRSWGEWSPWLMHEPDAKVTFSPSPGEEDGWYEWDGKAVGAGRLTHVRLASPSRVEQHLELQRPFRSQSEVTWELAGIDGGTRVTWTMEGAVPFLMRPMLPMMIRMIEKDYDLGLLLLRGCLDPDAERPQIRFLGEIEREPQRALCVPFKGGLEDVKDAMSEAFERLGKALEDAGVEPAGTPFTAYHKVDPKLMYFECDIAMPLPADAPDLGFDAKLLGGGRYFSVELKGSYEFLELAWHTAVCHLRMTKRKWTHKRDELEIYATDPSAVAHSNEVVTRILIPVRQ